jgi:hypothetical protein
MSVKVALELFEDVPAHVEAPAPAVDLSVVIPLFNEEANVEPLLLELFNVLRSLEAPSR